MQPEMLKNSMNITKIRYQVAIEGIINSNTKIIFSMTKDNTKSICGQAI